MGSAGLIPKKTDLQALVKIYDIDNSGAVSYANFMDGLRDTLSERKRKIVEKAYSSIDFRGEGRVSIRDMINSFNVSKNKDFLSNKKSRDLLVSEYLQGFEGFSGNLNGVVTK